MVAGLSSYKETALMEKSRNGSSRDDKRARFSGRSAKKQRISPALLIVGALVVVAVIGGLLIVLSNTAGKAAAATPGSPAAGAGNTVASGAAVAATLGHAPYPEVKADNGVIRLPAATFADNKARFYTYMNNGQPIEFFVVKGTDGQIHTAFNACDVCFPAKKGYHQEGDVMVCNNCGRRFATDQIGQVSGGCNPSPLTAKIEGDSVAIRVEDIVAGVGLFSFQ
jgi:hypothetical protein